MMSAQKVKPKTEVSALQPWHAQVAQHILANPRQTLTQIASYFKVSPGWLGTVVRSDCFKDYFKQLQGELQTAVVISLREKSTGIAHETMDRLLKKVESGNLPTEELLDVLQELRSWLNPSGAAIPGSGGNVQQNFMLVDPSLLAEARGKMREAMGGRPDDPDEAERQRHPAIDIQPIRAPGESDAFTDS